MNLFTSPWVWSTLSSMTDQADMETSSEKEADDVQYPSVAHLIMVGAGTDFADGAIGQKYALNPRGTLIGSGKDCDIFLPDHPDGDRKLFLWYDLSEQSWMMKNRSPGKHNRTYLNDLLTNFALLSSEDVIQMAHQGCTLQFFQVSGTEATLYDVLQGRIEEEKKRADTDGLTQIPNRGMLERNLEKELTHCRLYGRSLTALFLDIDLFKQVNTDFGHPGGDAVIKQVATTILEQIRPLDMLVRYGGEEFVLLLRDASYEHALAFAERIRGLIEKVRVKYLEREIAVTISIGLAMLEPDWSATDLIRYANDCLRMAKDQGRNRVVAHKWKE